MPHGTTVSPIFPGVFNHGEAYRRDNLFFARPILSLTYVIFSFINPI
jgi:hypothetical protein